MKLPDFELERFQSLYEHEVAFNLSESNVQALTLGDLLSPDDFEAILQLPLGYMQTNGPLSLRQQIAELHGATAENVLVTSGTVEANLLACLQILRPGDELIYAMPNYLQIKGLAEALGVTVRPLWLREELGWQPDLGELPGLLSKKTRMIAVCNPTNPTATLLQDEVVTELIAAAADAEAWLLADEIYRGSEHAAISHSVWGRYERVIVTGGMSKALALPGLRIGWLIAPPPVTEAAWGHKDYTSITAASLSYLLAERALEPTKRVWIRERNLERARGNLHVLTDWMAERGAWFQLVTPQAAAMAFVKYHFKIASVELSSALQRRYSVLLVPGIHFGVEGYLRLGYGLPAEQLTQALGVLDQALQEWGG